MPSDYVSFNWPGTNQDLPTFSPGGLPLTGGGLINPQLVSSSPFNISGSTLSSGIGGTTISFPGSGSSTAPSQTATNPLGTGAQTTGVSAPSLTPGSIGDFFARAIIVVLGFIFIAVGLRMLGVNVPKLNPA